MASPQARQKTLETVTKIVHDLKYLKGKNL